MAERILREEEVKQRTGLGRTTRWRLERVGKFPKKRSLGSRCVGWVESEVDAWILARAGANSHDNERAVGAEAGS
ncbi:helix-turn-helix transcriptional regulator [Thioalbus denitrificans]|uniref:helix-turn-helix transcriptional regulator n=1 Tax=Thioalbus denitrificans TaxID=547122 RepID=UPI000DF2CA9B|nr:AlpA family transcriptional regulator [Thioalbus denitrificans]